MATDMKHAGNAPVKHAGRPDGWRNNTSNGTTAAVKHVGGTDVKHHSHAGGGLLRGLNSR